jgi:release factor glutamine methyltransferase
MDNLSYLKKYYEGDLNEAIKRLENNEPLQYIVGHVEFIDYKIKVNSNVLIPRFETELLVTKIKEYANSLFKTKINILDIGTGSGCIAISLKKMINSDVDASDISPLALELAEENAILNTAKVTFILSDLFSNIDNKYDIIVSNPPYIDKSEYVMDLVKNNEPHLALYAEEKGLYFYQEIIKKIKPFLKDKFLIAFEIGSSQSSDIKKIIENNVNNVDIKIEKDLNDLDRYIFITSKSL